MHVGVPPHTPPHAPVPLGPCCLGGMVATILAFILISALGICHPVCLAFPFTHHQWPTTCAHRMPPAMGAVHCRMPGHRPGGCPVRQCNGAGMTSFFGIYVAYGLLGPPKICQAYAKRHKFSHHCCGCWVGVGRTPAWIPGDGTRAHLHPSYRGTVTCAWVGVSATLKCHLYARSGKKLKV